mgnify:CR=1 FL=1
MKNIRTKRCMNGINSCLGFEKKHACISEGELIGSITKDEEETIVLIRKNVEETIALISNCSSNAKNLVSMRKI